MITKPPHVDKLLKEHQKKMKDPRVKNKIKKLKEKKKKLKEFDKKKLKDPGIIEAPSENWHKKYLEIALKMEKNMLTYHKLVERLAQAELKLAQYRYNLVAEELNEKYL